MANYPSVTETANTSDITLTNGGNAGIGVTSISYPLHVQKVANSVTRVGVVNADSGSSAGTGVQLISYQGAAAMTKYGSGSAGKPKWLEIDSGTSAPLVLCTAATARVFVESGGDVGVGTNSPSAKLEVNGDLKVGGQQIVDSSGYLKPKSSSAASAPYGSIYIDSTSGKLCFKDSAGYCHDLY